jgi:hypothetical protein
MIVTAAVLASIWAGPVHAQAAAAAAAPGKGSVERTRATLEAYWQNHDPKYVAEDAVFIMMPTGEEIRGRAAIASHLEEFYGALSAHAERVNAIFSENTGLLEAMVVGTHNHDFAGVAASGRPVKVPLAVSYEMEGGLIKRARIYLMFNVLMAQIQPAS